MDRWTMLFAALLTFGVLGTSFSQGLGVDTADIEASKSWPVLTKPMPVTP